jgi:hypothetical protein
MYPHERSLVKDLEKKPFALVGVNADSDRAALVTTLKQEKISWRSFLDGGPGGPIAKAWGIRGFPSTFILDHKGVIRHTGLRGEKMAEAVHELLKEQEADPVKLPVARTTPEKTGINEPRRTDIPKRGVAQLSAEVVDATPAERTKLIENLRDSKGAENTQALAQAITQLDGDAKKKARQALAERLSNMKASTLEGYLQEVDPEMRRAAALATAMKEDITFVGKLIDLLNDQEKTVERAACAALKALTKQDFGPAADASASEKAKAVKAWKAWWKRHEQ